MCIVYYANNNNSPFAFHPFSHAAKFMKAKQTCHRAVWSLHFVLWRALQQKFYRPEIQNVDHLKRVLLHCWNRKDQDAIKGALKRQAMEFRGAHAVDMLNSCRPIVSSDVNSQH